MEYSNQTPSCQGRSELLLSHEAPGLVTPFFFDGLEVRVIVLGGEPWFVAKDVATALEYADTDQAIRAHCKAAKTYPVNLTGQVRHVRVIPERDIYRLIMRSKRPSAQSFEELVVGEILPSIRRTGSYGQPVIDVRDMGQLSTIALQLIEVNSEQREAIVRLEGEVMALEPKAEAYDVLDGSEGSVGVRLAAKALGVPERKFTAWLEANGWAFRHNGGSRQGYAAKRNAGYLEHRSHTYFDEKRGEYRTSVEMLITPKGLAKLADIFAKTGFPA